VWGRPSVSGTSSKLAARVLNTELRDQQCEHGHDFRNVISKLVQGLKFKNIITLHT
jgi:hypothetical protein